MKLQWNYTLLAIQHAWVTYPAFLSLCRTSHFWKHGERPDKIVGALWKPCQVSSYKATKLTVPWCLHILAKLASFHGCTNLAKTSDKCLRLHKARVNQDKMTASSYLPSSYRLRSQGNLQETKGHKKGSSRLYVIMQAVWLKSLV